MAKLSRTFRRFRKNLSLSRILAGAIGRGDSRGTPPMRPLLEALELRQLLTAVFPEIDIRGNGQSIVDGDATPSTADFTDFGNVDVNTGFINRSFTIANTGVGALNLTGSTKVRVTGANSADFVVVTQPTSPVAALTGTTTFKIKFNPSATGARVATVSVYNDDDDENPYNFSVTGTGTVAPEVDVKGNGISIINNDATPGTSDFSDFGSVETGSGLKSRTFTILNTGSGTLTFAGGPNYVSLGGADAADFAVSAQPSGTIAAGASTTFTVDYDPSATGVSNASISFDSDDADEGTYTFNIRGTGVNLPEINVQGNGVDIVDGDTTPAVGDDTDFGSVEVVGATQTKTYTIQNVGSATLNLTSTPIVKVGGANAGDFTVTTQPAGATIAAAANRTFVVTFNPSAAGLRSAIVTIADNDSNENPYNFTVQGTGSTSPEIQVTEDDGTTDIADTSAAAGDRDFGSAQVSADSVVRTFIIKNVGSSVMALTGSPRVTSDDPQFAITTQPSAASIAANGQLTFQVTFTPTAAGVQGATLTITNDDPDGGEGTFTFDVTGTGTVAPEIVLRGDSALIDIASGDSTPTTTDETDFGSANITGATVVKTFRIYNTGTDDLTMDTGGSPRVVVTGTDFTLSSDAADAAITAGTFATFDVTFDPTLPGLQTATVTINNNDATGGENPYTFTIQGTGTSNVEIAVSGNGNDISDNDTTPAAGDFTSFGSATIGVSTVTRTFTITNSGSDALNLTNAPLVLVSGTNASEFVVTSDPDASVSPAGGTTTFDVTFDPEAAGTRNATITIFNDDTDESAFTFDISGTAVAAPEIDVTFSDTAIADEDATPSVGEGTDFGTLETAAGSATSTYTIHNLGSGLLTLTSVALAAPNVNYTVVQPSSMTVQPDGGTVTFQIVYNPTAAATDTATLNIVSDDADEATYNFDLTGTGADANEISIVGNGQEIVSGDTAPISFDGTDFGPVELAVGSVKHTFTIKNTGSAALDLTDGSIVAVAGGQAGDFTITQPTVDPVPAGSETTFDIVFNPSGAGIRSTTVTVLSDDTDEGSYTFSIQGSGVAAPEITVEGNSIEVADGDDSPRTADDTDFGSVDIGSAFATHTFTITNTGSATLNLSDTPRVTITGTDAAAFSVFVQPGASVAMAGSTTFQVRFAPDAIGFKTATVRISNNDLDESLYNFDVAGLGITAPEIDIKGNSTSITSGDTTPSTSDYSDFGSIDINAGAITRTFTILNSGSDDLNLIGGKVSISGLDAADFTLVAQPTTPVTANGGTATFQVRFDPSVGGTRTALITVENDDSSEGTFTYAIAGTALVVPEISVVGNALDIASGAAAAATKGTDFGNVDVASGSVTRTFTINNTGSGVLRLTGSPKVSIGGAGAAAYSLTQVPATRIAALSGSTTFQITFNPAAAATYAGILTIANNDSDESSFVMNLTGVGVNLPEMQTSGNSQIIADGDATPTTADFTDFGSTDVSGGTVLRTFTVENLGAGALNFTASGAGKVVLAGTNAADFSVSAQLPASVTATDGAPGGTDETTFQITFNPSAAGLRTATLSIANNDSDENPYNFTIQGTGTTAPEIEMRGNNVIIASGDNTPDPADHTNFGNAEINTASVTRTFTIKNTGSGALALSGSPIIQLSGADAAQFSVVGTAPTTPVAATTGTTTFQVKFDPTSAGTKSATVTVLNTDSDEGTFTFDIEGAGILAPEAEVYGNATLIADGDTTPATADFTDFGSVAKDGGTVLRTFTIKNTGSAGLDLTNGSLVTVTQYGVQVGFGDFSVSTVPADDPVAANNGTTTYVITFAPTAVGTRQAVITVNSDDSDEGAYDFVVKGTGLSAPEINIRGNGQDIVDGDNTPDTNDWSDFGNADVASVQTSHTFTIQNTGSAALSLSGTTKVVVSGANASDFVVTTQPGASVAAAASTTFVVRFDPSAAGLRTATLTIANNDGNENPYNFDLQGTGTTAAEIDVQGNSVSIVDGDSTPATADYTDFGTVELNQGTLVRTFTVRNVGSEALNLDALPGRVTITGANSGDFALLFNPRASIAPGATSTFQVEFNPSATGIRAATITVNSDDGDEAAYNFDIQGNGAIQPEIAVSGNGQDIVNGDTTPTTADFTNFGSIATAGGTITRTFTIANIGSDNLTLSGTPKIQILGTNAADFTVTLVPTSPVAASGSTTFEITFDPSATGIRNAQIKIVNDDSDEGTFLYNITGKGV